jgi:hypothetical protein
MYIFSSAWKEQLYNYICITFELCGGVCLTKAYVAWQYKSDYYLVRKLIVNVSGLKKKTNFIYTG